MLWLNTRPSAEAGEYLMTLLPYDFRCNMSLKTLPLSKILSLIELVSEH